MDSIHTLLKQVCRETENSDKRVTFYEDYSGRGMRGRPCIGITGKVGDCWAVIGEAIRAMVDDLFSAAADMTDEDANEVHEHHSAVQNMIGTLTSRWQSDNMGYDTIIYWPTIRSEDAPTR